VEHIRSPWRHAYVTKADQQPGCVMCAAYAGREDEASLVVHTAELNFVVMNLYPYNSGHLMIAPLRHVARLQDATAEELGEMMALARRLESILQEVYKPDGLNIGMNLGRPAGAGVAHHIHLHVVPRWSGDTNFMTVLAQTRVIPEDPLQACATLRRHFDTTR
jgi:ATP adenylyltransferase